MSDEPGFGTTKASCTFASSQPKAEKASVSFLITQLNLLEIQDKKAGGQRIGGSGSASVLPMNIQG